MVKAEIKSPDDIASDFETMIVDVDGTLYRLFPLRFRMAVMITADLLLHPGKLPLFRALIYFRKIRKKPEYLNAGMEKQVHYSADKYGQKYEKTYDYICRWLFEKPLDVIPEYKYESILKFVNDFKRKGKKIVVYSDYPAEDKLSVLGLQYDLVFYPGSGIPDVLKPSRDVMRAIVDSIGTEPEKVLYIGDDIDKDGVSAEFIGTAYMDVGDLRKIIRKSGRTGV